MDESDDLQQNTLNNNDPKEPVVTLQKFAERFTRAVDDLDEIFALHRWICDALHTNIAADSKDSTEEFAVYALLRMLKERDQVAKANFHSLHKQVRNLCKPDSIEEMRGKYHVVPMYIQ